MSSPCTWLYDLRSLSDKQAKKMQPVQVVVGEASPGLGLVVVVALSLMSTSLQRNVSCSSSASRAYASFSTTRTETQGSRAGVVVQLKEQPFSHHGMHTSRPKKISKLFPSELSRRYKRRVYWVAYKKTSCDRDRAISLACHWRGSASYRLRDPGRRLRRPAISKLSFSNAENGRLTKTS